MSDPARRAFVLCPNYHGATVLATLLGRNPNIVHLGDTNPPKRNHEACGCGLPIGECPFWQGLRRDLELEADYPHKKWMPRFPVFTGRYKVDRALTLGFAVANRAVGRRLDAAVSAAARDYRRIGDGLARYATDWAGAEVFVDGEKSLAKALFLTSDDVSRARIIHLVRDPRGFALSSMSRGRGTPESLGRDWRRGHNGLRRALRLLGSQAVLTVRYEDIAREPAALAERIHDFLGITDSPDRPNPDQQHVIGNRMLIDFDGSVQLDEKWREELPPAEAARILRDAGSFATAMGYR